ncbi:hypothetical protein SNEBB_004351 [Seison nebaliae]|nr:hypothetical protein SNEBB_004351 [Seison nebaliae]
MIPFQYYEKQFGISILCKNHSNNNNHYGDDVTSCIDHASTFLPFYSNKLNTFLRQTCVVDRFYVQTIRSGDKIFVRKTLDGEKELIMDVSNEIDRGIIFKVLRTPDSYKKSDAFTWSTGVICACVKYRSGYRSKTFVVNKRTPDWNMLRARMNYGCY